jgi:hypothetical protein
VSNLSKRPQTVKPVSNKHSRSVRKLGLDEEISSASVEKRENVRFNSAEHSDLISLTQLYVGEYVKLVSNSKLILILQTIPDPPPLLG